MSQITPTHPELLALVAKWRAWPAGSVADNYQAGQCWAANSCASELQAAIASLAAHRGEVEPVAWQYRFKFTHGEWSGWATTKNAGDMEYVLARYKAIDTEAEGRELYTHPPQAQTGAGDGVAEVAEAEVRKALADHVAAIGSQKEFAQHWVHASESYVTDVLRGRRAVPETWVAILGYRMTWVKDACNRTTIAALEAKP